MLIEDYIIEEARTLLRQEGTKLPAPIPSAPTFYLARHDDHTIIAFAALQGEDEVEYKIGPKKV
jgi:hypothetical protein